MKVLENKTLYKCDFCNKKYQVKRFAEHHEKHCGRNPPNQHKCFQECKFLEKQKEKYDSGDDYYNEPIMREKTIFICKHSGNRMYSYIAERKGLVSHQEDAIRMPLECGDFKSSFEDLMRF